MRCWAFRFAMVSALVSHFKVLAMVVPRNLYESTSSNCCSLIGNGVIAVLFFLKSMIISFVFATFSSRSFLVHQSTTRQLLLCTETLSMACLGA